MNLQVKKCELADIEHLRVLFLHEHELQFIYDKCHLYGWADHYIFAIDEEAIGYGCTWGKDKREDRDAIFEFYLLKPFRKLAGSIFSQFQATCKAPFVEYQSNDKLLAEMAFEHAHQISAEAILFKDHNNTSFDITGAAIHRVPQEKVGNTRDIQYLLKWNDELVATGGFMLNYNMPYADIYYEVLEQYRHRGLGTFFIQELKKAIYLMGRVPAARCNIKNPTSKAALLKAGLEVCGHILTGVIKN